MAVDDADPGVPPGLAGAEAPGPAPPSTSFEAWTPSRAALPSPPLLRVPAGIHANRGDALERRYAFRMRMAFGAAGVMSAGLLPLTLAIALHEIWPCAGIECRGVASAVGIGGLAGLSLFLFGAGATAHWATSAASALYDGHPPFGAVWLGRVGFSLWAVSEVLMTLALPTQAAPPFWGGLLIGLASMPLALGQLIVSARHHARRVLAESSATAGLPLHPSPEILP